MELFCCLDFGSKILKGEDNLSHQIEGNNSQILTIDSALLPEDIKNACIIFDKDKSNNIYTWNIEQKSTEDFPYQEKSNIRVTFPWQGIVTVYYFSNNQDNLNGITKIFPNAQAWNPVNCVIRLTPPVHTLPSVSHQLDQILKLFKVIKCSAFEHLEQLLAQQKTYVINKTGDQNQEEGETCQDPYKTILDQAIRHLRLCHNVCFYCASVSSCPEDLYSRCGSVHLRQLSSKSSMLETNNQNSEEKIEKQNSEYFDWLIGRFVSVMGTHLPPIPLDTFLETKHVEVQGEGKYGCKHCPKLFKGPSFVVKHLHLKHQETVVKGSIEYLDRLNQFLSNPGRCLPIGMHLFDLEMTKPPCPIGWSTQSHFLQARRSSSSTFPISNRPIRQYVDIDKPMLTLPQAQNLVRAEQISYDE